MSKSLWQGIADRLRIEIESGRLNSGDRLPTSDTLAETEGVSRLTAHRALEELQRQGLVIRDGRRGTVVTQRRRKSIGRIALVLDQVDFNLQFPRPELLGGIHSGLDADQSLVLCDCKASVDREISLLRQMADETDGILCWPSGDSRVSATLNELVDRGVPLVLLDRVPEGVHADAVVSDSVGATRRAMDFLFGRGHEKIGLFTFSKPGVSTVIERSGTFESMMEERRLGSAEHIRRFAPSLEVTERAFFSQVVYDALYTLVHGPDPITAVLCVQDMVGLAVLDCAAEMGLAIPDDLEVATFNDWPPMWLHRPWQAHRIAIQPDEMGRVAIARLQAQISGADHAHQVHLIQAKFIAAASTMTTSPDSESIPNQRR
jgi:DNA-binding LacI/PurR family transcriptional regulator